MDENFFTPSNYEQALGKTFYSSWILIDQKRISDFGRVTDDPDPHHVDPAWTEQNSPWGKKTISFGWLTVSMLTPMLYEVVRYPLDGDAEQDGYPVSYGFNRLRFVEPVMVDSSIRGRFKLVDATERKPGRVQLSFDITVEIEGVSRPALIAEYLFLWVKGKGETTSNNSSNQ